MQSYERGVEARDHTLPLETNRGKDMEEEERLWTTDVTVIAKATTMEEAEEKIRKGYVLIDDILEDIKLETMDHLKGESRDKMTQRIFRALQRREQHPSASIW